MAIYYVDYEGAQGTGDGTSFANRAGDVQSLGSHTQYTPDNQADEVRIMKGATTNLTGGKVRRMGWWNLCGYDYCGLSTSNSYWTFSTTKGQTGFKYNSYNAGLGKTGDFIEINYNRWYYTNNTLGDTSTSQVPGNMLGLNGLWRITVAGDWIYLDEYTAPFNKGQSDSWSNMTLPDGTTGNFFSQTTAGKWKNVSASVVDFPSTALPIKSIASYDDDRLKWTIDDGNSTSYDYWQQESSWSSHTNNMTPVGCDKIQISSSTAAGTLVAHYELPSGAMDLSAYQGVSFHWHMFDQGNTSHFQTPSATVHGRFSLNLCTDTAGTVVAHKIPFDTRYFGRRGRAWQSTDLGGNLNSSIKSVAIYKDYAFGSSVTYGLANIIAYKTASGQKLNHSMVISAKTTNDPDWHAIRYIDEKHNAIKLLTSGRYVQDGYDEGGYYGGSFSCKWSGDQSNLTVYAEDAYPMGVAADHTTAHGDASSMTNNTWKYYWDWCNFGSNNATTPVVVSGGWNRTDMSSKVSGDITHFRHPASHYYAGPRMNNSSTDTFTDFSDMSFHFMRTQPYAQRGKFANIYCNCPTNGSYFGGNYSRGVGIRQWAHWWEGGSNVFTGSSQVEADNAAIPSSDNYMYLWGHNGQSNAQMGYFGAGRKWSVVDLGAFGSYIRLQSDSNMSNIDARDNFDIELLVTHNSPKNRDIIYMEYVKGGKIRDWHSTFNSLAMGSKSEVTIYDMDWDQGDMYTDRWGSGWNNTQAIRWESKNIQLLGGTSEGTIYFGQNARIRGWGYTGTQNHSLNNEDREIMFADINGVSGNGQYLRYYWKIEPESTIRHTASGLAWKMSKSSSNASPIYEIAKVAVAGSGTVTVKLWVYRTVSGTNTYALLRIPQDDSLGITKSEMNGTNGAPNTWYELTVTATPTAAGIMSVELELMDTTNSGFFYFDDLSITQS